MHTNLFTLAGYVAPPHQALSKYPFMGGGENTLEEWSWSPTSVFKMGLYVVSFVSSE